MSAHKTDTLHLYVSFKTFHKFCSNQPCEMGRTGITWITKEKETQEKQFAQGDKVYSSVVQRPDHSLFPVQLWSLYYTGFLKVVYGCRHQNLMGFWLEIQTRSRTSTHIQGQNLWGIEPRTCKVLVKFKKKFKNSQVRPMKLTWVWSLKCPWIYIFSYTFSLL